MDKSKIDKRASSVNIKSNSKREFFLLHGYTGSPTDFNELGEYLNKRFNANVRIIRLKGHGKTIGNLDNLNYDDFLLQADKELRKDLNKGREIIVGGTSIGSLIALQLSAKYPVKGVLSISTPYKERLGARIVSFFEPIIFKKHWKKIPPEYGRELRKNAFYYDVSLRGLKIIKQARKKINKVLDKISAPCLFVHVESDRIFHSIGVEILKKRISSRRVKSYLFKAKDRASHNPFYSPQHKNLYKVMGDFVQENKLFGN